MFEDQPKDQGQHQATANVPVGIAPGREAVGMFQRDQMGEVRVIKNIAAGKREVGQDEESCR